MVFRLLNFQAAPEFDFRQCEQAISRTKMSSSGWVPPAQHWPARQVSGIIGVAEFRFLPSDMAEVEDVLKRGLAD
jgi:hypothetical protein